MQVSDFKSQDITSKEELNNPFVALNRWMSEAKEKGIKNYNSVSLATVDINGHPDARQMLIKDIDVESGTLVFYTNEHSAKGKELENHPFVCLNAYWPPLDRSYRIRGQVEFVTPEESDEYWKTRNLEARISSSVSQQGAPLDSKENFITRLEEAKSKAEKEGSIERPSHWHGYRVYAHSIELWMEGSEKGRIHTRIQWDRQAARKGKSISEISGFEMSPWTCKHLQP